MRKGESHSRNIPHRLAMAVLLVSTALSSRPAAALTGEEILNYKGADREQQLIEGAKKEGAVVFYSGVIVNQALRPIAEGFMKKYPFIKMTYWRAETEDIVAKVSAEERANNIVGDVLEGTGLGDVAVDAGIVQPFYSPLVEEYPSDYRDPDHMWVATRLSYFGTSYNTKLVPEGTEPKSYEDLLDPKWKGKMSWRIGTSTGTPLFITNLRLAWGEDKAMAYFQKLKDQKIVNFGSGSARTLVDRVMAGEYPIGLQIFAHHPLISKAKGAPVNTVLMDPVPVLAAPMQVTKNLPHPNAAMLLVDFIISKEGQQILANAEYYPALPAVPPLPELAPVVPRTAGVPENFITPHNFAKDNESSQKIYDDLFR
jgi:ABC-type Fe3+ transport system substrate-binding protein